MQYGKVGCHMVARWNHIICIKSAQSVISYSLQTCCSCMQSVISIVHSPVEFTVLTKSRYPNVLLRINTISTSISSFFWLYRISCRTALISCHTYISSNFIIASHMYELYLVWVNTKWPWSQMEFQPRCFTTTLASSVHTLRPLHTLRHDARYAMRTHAMSIRTLTDIGKPSVFAAMLGISMTPRYFRFRRRIQACSPAAAIAMAKCWS